MADSQLDNSTIPDTPAAGKLAMFVDSTTKKLCYVDDTGHVNGSLSRNNATTSQAPAAATDVYIAGSSLLIPSFGMQVGQHFRWFMGCSKTGAGTVQPQWNIRLGSNQSTADTSRVAITTSGQTAAADNGLWIIEVSVVTVSTTGTIWGMVALSHTLVGGSGFGGEPTAPVTSSNFDNSAVGGQYLGISVNTGTSAAWTFTSVISELIG